MSVIAHPSNLIGGDFDFIRYHGNPYKKYKGGPNQRNGTPLFYLPMPSEIQDNLEASWAAQNNWLRSVKNAGASYKEAIAREFKDSGNWKGHGVLEKITEQTIEAFGGQGAIQRNFQRERGMIFNPASEQFFSGMSHRTFEFTHKLVAETPEESRTIGGIINGIKAGASASVPTSGVQRGIDKDVSVQVLPMLWKVDFMLGGGRNPFLPMINKCAITQVATNYSGAGTWARHPDGAPVEIDLTITMVELVTPTAANFGGTGGFSTTNSGLRR